MFEQNNIGVRCEHPVAAIASTLTPNNQLIAPILSAAEAISQSLEGDIHRTFVLHTIVKLDLLSTKNILIKMITFYLLRRGGVGR